MGVDCRAERVAHIRTGGQQGEQFTPASHVLAIAKNPFQSVMIRVRLGRKVVPGRLWFVCTLHQGSGDRGGLYIIGSIYILMRLKI